ncbi:MAG: spore maturation protein [Ruminococcus sp.]|nr:spore maturation protein [Ruminococcus sp.]
MRITSLVVPVFVLGVILYSLHKKTGVFDTFIAGAKENIAVCFDILPSLVALMLAVEMFKASGALSALTNLIEPITSIIGIPSECVPLALMRPVSGSGALSMLDSILSEYGADSFIGRVASVLMGSTETTLYTVAVYFGAVKIKKTRHALPSALVGDFTAFILSALAVRLFLGA